MSEIYEKIKKTLGATSHLVSSEDTHSPTQPKLKIDQTLFDILKEFGTPIEFELGANFTSTNKTEYSVETIYGLSSDKYNIYFKNESLKNQIPKDYYVFGDSGEGDYYCISKSNGEVFFWEHDSTTHPLTYLSKNISEFLQELTPDSPPSKEDLEKLKKIVKFEIDF